MPGPDVRPDMARIWTVFAVEGLVFAALLFGGAGTLRWGAGWVFFAAFFIPSTLMIHWLARNNPALLVERTRPPIQAGQPLWDRLIMAALLALFPAWLVLMGVDARRLGWSHMPPALQWIGCAGILAAMWIFHVSVRANTFLAVVVRIQAERGHEVVSSGPYAIVRHPLYAGALLLFVSSALLLGSWWGLLASVDLAAPLVLRTVLEDRELHRSLPGYADYARRVRWRLLPGVW